MKIKLSEIINNIKDEVIDIQGNVGNITITNIREASKVDELSLDWVNPQKRNKQEIAENSKAKAILVDQSVEYLKTITDQKKVLIHVNDPKYCIAKIANEFFVKKTVPKVDKTAIIDSEALIGKNVFIGPNCILGKCTIGDNVTLHGNIYIYDNVTIYNNVEIHAGVTIGNEAHNFVEDLDGVRIKFPHLGGVIIEDDIVVGANSVISRGVLGDTIIGKGTKIAQMVLIGANNIIGSNCLIRGGAITLGSVKLGENTLLAPAVVIRDQITIGNNCIIGMGAIVTKDVPSGETWYGNPAKKMS